MEVKQIYELMNTVTIDKSMTVKIDSLVMRTIANMIGTTVYSDYKGAEQNTKSGVKAVNLLKLYKDQNASAADMTAAQAITNPDFIRFASYIMGMYEKRLATISTLFNVDCGVSGSNYTFTAYGKTFTITNEDKVTIA